MGKTCLLLMAFLNLASISSAFATEISAAVLRDAAKYGFEPAEAVEAEMNTPGYLEIIVLYEEGDKLMNGLRLEAAMKTLSKLKEACEELSSQTKQMTDVEFEIFERICAPILEPTEVGQLNDQGFFGALTHAGRAIAHLRPGRVPY
jgi:hypothetical protein